MRVVRRETKIMSWRIKWYCPSKPTWSAAAAATMVSPSEAAALGRARSSTSAKTA
ncbi:hypothetical protein YC2023_044033 [Brassica napus]